MGKKIWEPEKWDLSNKRDIRNITIPFYVGEAPAGTLKKHKPVKGFDTETENGFVVMITDSDGRELVSNDIEEYLAFLVNIRYRDTVNFFFNLKYDFAAILKWLPIENQRSINSFGSTMYLGYKIVYIPKKQFKISRINEKTEKCEHYVIYWDAMQFYPNMSLKDAAIKYKIGLLKGDIPDVAGITYYQLTTDQEYKDMVYEYCTGDSEVCRRLMKLYIDSMNVEYPQVNNYLSVATVSRQIFSKALTEGSRFGMPTSKIGQQCALNAYHAGFIETMKVGTAKKCVDSDLNSAYPFAMSNMLNPKGIVSGKREYDPDCDYGYYKVLLDLDVEISPLWHEYKQTNYHPVGESIETWISKPEYEYLIKLTDLKVLYACQLKCIDKEPPFKYLIEDIYNKRLDAKKDNDLVKSNVYKIALNSLYGLTMNTNVIWTRLLCGRSDPIETIETQKIEEFEESDGSFTQWQGKLRAGSMFNPFFGCDTTSRIRVAVLEALKGKESSVIQINTDGIKATGKLKNLKYGDKLGEFSLLKYPKDTLVLGTGRIFVKDDQDGIDDDLSRFRGVGVAPSEILESYKVYHDKYGVPLTYNHVTTLKESLTHQAHIGDLNVFKDCTKTMKCGGFNRIYDKLYYMYDELLDSLYGSRPMNIEEIPDRVKMNTKWLKEHDLEPCQVIVP